MTIRDLLKASQAQLDADTAALDCEILLAHCLGKDRTYLYTWPEQQTEISAEKKFQDLLRRRIEGEPIAYLIGHREFWSLSLSVNSSTLIPRPDTERLVEVALELLAVENARVLDLGTGTGAIALALAKEKSSWQLLGVDIAIEAVQLAQKNAATLAIRNAHFMQSNWFEHIDTQRFDLIVSNPPYIAADDPHLQQGDVRFEPSRALIADNNGLAAIETIAHRAKNYLQANGWLLFEHGYRQAPAVRTLLSQLDYSDISTWHDWSGNERVTGGRAR